MHQPESALAQWFNARLAGANGRMKKVLIVALMRKLVIALWRLTETGEVPARRAPGRTLKAQRASPPTAAMTNQAPEQPK